MPMTERRTFLKQAAASCALLSQAGAATKPANVVLIYADDLGYGDLGCYGSGIRTPNLDSLARDGMRFTHFYSANPVCSPSRAALLTGRYPTRVGVPKVLFPHAESGLDPSETTIAALLKTQNYRTACVGKWHLGDAPQYLPARRGFDSYFGIPYSNDMNPPVVLRQANDKTEVVEERATLATLTARYTSEAVQFIEKSKDNPFFLYMPHTFPHIPLAASERFRRQSPYGIYGDVVEELDWSVGEVLRTLKQTGNERNTLVLFSSDNGPWYQGSAGRLRGRKGTTWEGGVREPFLARMPGRIAAGRVCDSVTSTMDILPTVASLCNMPLPAKPLDGINIWPLLSGQKTELEREALLYFDDVHLQCARWKQWKLHVARYNSKEYTPVPPGGRINLPLRNPELYDVVRDVSESYDVAAENPEVVAEINGRIQRLLPSFPENIRAAWSKTREKETVASPAGHVPRIL